ncbi:MAG TPA: TRAP transporter substrate-binding protein [Stellaceae bacterium]|nr:TRAP transporter substrate-binding protein [Stellaceae bacterium]
MNKNTIVGGARRFALAFSMAASLAAPWAGIASAEDAKTFTMKLGSLTAKDEVEQWMHSFVAGIEQKSAGRLKAEIFTSGQLGSAAREIEGTQFGSIQAILMPPDFFSGIDERFEVGSAPGTFTSFDQASRVVFDAEFRKSFLALGNTKGLVGLGLFVNAPVTILTRNPSRHLADFQGLKIRILSSDFQIEQIKRLGATPVAMSLGDVGPALQQGAIDGALASVPAFTPQHFYDIAKYMTETSQYYVLIVAEMSKKWFDTLPEDLQKMVLAEAETASRDIIPWQKQDMDAQRKTWVEHGGELIQLPPAEEAELMKRMSTIADDVGAKRPAIKEMYDQLKAAVKRNP